MHKISVLIFCRILLKLAIPSSPIHIHRHSLHVCFSTMRFLSSCILRRVLPALVSCAVALPYQVQSQQRHNVIIFVADGLRRGSVNAADMPTFLKVRSEGVDFSNSPLGLPNVYHCQCFGHRDRTRPRRHRRLQQLHLSGSMADKARCSRNQWLCCSLPRER